MVKCHSPSQTTHYRYFAMLKARLYLFSLVLTLYQYFNLDNKLCNKHFDPRLSILTHIDSHMMKILVYNIEIRGYLEIQNNVNHSLTISKIANVENICNVSG